MAKRILHTSRAFVERPGRSMAGHGVVAEGFNLPLVHSREEVPGLVVLTRMVEAEPHVLAQTFATPGDLVAAFALAARLGARAELCLLRLRAWLIRFDADIGLVARILF